MSPYYVYMYCWFRETDEGNRRWSGYLLTCESRYVADEFFRTCQDLINIYGQPWFTKLERSNPQFWIYDCTHSDPRTAPANALRRDWVNGNTYYVRNIRQPNLYWYTTGEGGSLSVSSGGPQTKFRVVGTDLGSDKRVLIRSDVVRLEIPQTNPVVSLRYDSNSSLTYASGGEDWTFRFEDLLGKFRITWSTTGPSWMMGYVMWDNGGDQDEWELC